MSEFRQTRTEYPLDKEIETLDDLKLIDTNNTLLVELISDTSKYEGSNLEVVKDWSAGEHAERVFKVVKKPQTVFFDPRYPNCNSSATDMEVNVGDTIFINLTESLNTLIFSFKGKRYHTIKYDSIVCALRGDEIIPVNGYVLITPIKETRKALSHEVEYIVPNEGEVAHIGSRNKDYKRNYRGRTLKRMPSEKQFHDCDDSDLEVGDVVNLESQLAVTGLEQGASVWPLEASSHRVLDKPYFVIQRPKIRFIRK